MTTPSPSIGIRAMTELDDILSDSTISPTMRTRLVTVRSEFADMMSPTFRSLMLQRTPMDVSLTLALNGTSDDLEASRWLAQTFASPSFLSIPQSGSHQLGGHPTNASHLSFLNEGLATLDLLSPGFKISRHVARHTRVLAPPDVREDNFDALNDEFFGSISFLAEVGDPEFNIRQVLASVFSGDERRLFLSVAASVLSQYLFLNELQIDIHRLASFVSAIYESLSTRENPFNNAVRAADTLQLVHAALRQDNVAEHLADMEIVATLVAALSMDAGHCGVSNEFLCRIQHPLSVIFGCRSPQESATIAYVNSLLDRDEYNFFANSSILRENPEMQYKFAYILSEIVLGSAPKQHDAWVSKARCIAMKTYVAEEDIPSYLGIVVHAADYGYMMKPRAQHIEWVTLMLTENMRQGAEEERRRLAVSPLCGPDAGEHVSAALHAMIRHVLIPLFSALGGLLPPWWASQLEKNRVMYYSSSTTSGKEDDEHATSPPILFEAVPVNPWCDIIHPVIGALRKVVGTGGLPALDRKASQHAILHATPQRQLSSMNASTSRNVSIVGSSSFGDAAMSSSLNGAPTNGSTSRTEHYYTLLKMFEAFDRDNRSFADFSGNAVFLASQLDPMYLGEYARNSGNPTSVSDAAAVARLVVDTENPPSSAEVIASPTQRKANTTDVFLLQLLHMYQRLSQQRGVDGLQSVHGTPSDASEVMQPSLNSRSPAGRRRIQSDNPIYGPR